MKENNVVSCEHCMNQQVITEYDERLIKNGYGIICKICGNLIYSF